jgi:RNA polymerase sigma factor (sigma-70 family)
MASDDSRFPLTRHSVLADVRSDDVAVRQLAWDALVRAYWKPIYKYLRLRWRAAGEQARDWTQEFFARALEKGFFDRFDPARARFRTFLRVCIDGFVGRERETERRLKRGGGVAPISLDFAAAEGELAGVEPPAPDRVDEYFHREWMRSLFEVALEDLQRVCDAEGKKGHFDLFRRYDLQAPEREEKLSYADVAREFSLPITQVTNCLHWTRAKLRELLLARLEQLCASDEEFRAEAKALLGVDPK